MIFDRWTICTVENILNNTISPWLVEIIIYIWSKSHSNQIVLLFFFIRMRAAYLPYAFMAMELLFRGNIFFDVVGLVIGHIFYYLYFIVPKLPFTRGINVFSAPRPIKWLVGMLQLDSKRELIIEEGDFVEDDNFIPNLR